MGMTMTRNTKAQVNSEAHRILNGGKAECHSPANLDKYGRYFPQELALRIAVSKARPNRTYGRTRVSVHEDRMQARRSAGRVRVY